MRVVIDTNITISGLLFGGLPLKIVRMCLHRQFVWVISPPRIEELERVMPESPQVAGAEAKTKRLVLDLLVEMAEVAIKTVKAATLCST